MSLASKSTAVDPLISSEDCTYTKCYWYYCCYQNLPGPPSC